MLGDRAMLTSMTQSDRTDDRAASTGTREEDTENAPAGAQREDPGASSLAVAGGDSLRRSPSVALLADLERRVRRLEARVDELGSTGGSSRRRVKPSDMVRWGLWLVVIAFLGYFWLRMGGAPR
jgi:hypothetical protein